MKARRYVKGHIHKGNENSILNFEITLGLHGRFVREEKIVGLFSVQESIFLLNFKCRPINKLQY